MSSRKRVAIIGAGISGLSAAYYLTRASEKQALDVEVHLLERSTRLGGVIRTERSDGFLFEWGPENFVPFKPEAVRLVEELGLGQELIGSNDAVRQTYVTHAGKLYSLPDGMVFLAPVRLRPFWATPLLSTKGKLRAMMEPFIPRSRGDLTVRVFLERRLGRELTERVAEPLVSAIYGGDIDQLSAVSALSDTHRTEQKHGSLWNGLRKSHRSAGSKLPFFVTLRSGMETLVRGLLDALRDRVVIQTGAERLEVERRGGGFLVRNGRESHRYECVVSCVPAGAAAGLLRPISAVSASELAEIRYTSTSLIYLAYKRSEFSHPLRGFGFVTPANESDVLDACTWVSTKFEGRSPDDSVLLRCAVHDGRKPRTFSSDQANQRPGVIHTGQFLSNNRSHASSWSPSGECATRCRPIIATARCAFENVTPESSSWIRNQRR
ncbi:MAG: protoporphyrinogen oxidase [Acidobacteriota bacterium]